MDDLSTSGVVLRRKKEPVAEEPQPPPRAVMDGTDEDESAPPPKDLAEFLTHFLKNHRDDNFLSVKHGNYNVNGRQEAVGEIIDWTLQYLHYM